MKWPRVFIVGRHRTSLRVEGNSEDTTRKGNNLWAIDMRIPWITLSFGGGDEVPDKCLTVSIPPLYWISLPHSPKLSRARRGLSLWARQSVPSRNTKSKRVDSLLTKPKIKCTGLLHNHHQGTPRHDSSWDSDVGLSRLLVNPYSGTLTSHFRILSIDSTKTWSTKFTEKNKMEDLRN